MTSITTYGKHTDTTLNPKIIIINNTIKIDIELEFAETTHNDSVILEIYRGKTEVLPRKPAYCFILLNNCEGLNLNETISCNISGKKILMQLIIEASIDLSENYLQPVINNNGELLRGKKIRLPKILDMSVEIERSFKVYKKNMKTVENPTEVNVGESLIYNYTIHLNGFQNISDVIVEIRKVMNNNTTVHKFLPLEDCIEIDRTEEFSCLKNGDIVYVQVNLTVTMELNIFSIFPAINVENYIFCEKAQRFPKIIDAFIALADHKNIKFLIIEIISICLFLLVVTHAIIKIYRLKQAPAIQNGFCQGTIRSSQALIQLEFQDDDDENNEVPMVINDIPGKKKIEEDKP